MNRSECINYAEGLEQILSDIEDKLKDKQRAIDDAYGNLDDAYKAFVKKEWKTFSKLFCGAAVTLQKEL